jgi:hypothetical protein
MTRIHAWAAACLVAAWAGSGVASSAQTREDTIAAAQADKARSLAPYTPNRAEGVVNAIEDNEWVLGLTPRGWYPTFGTVYLGQGFTWGGGYRKYTGFETFVDAHALLTTNWSQLYEVTVGSANYFGGRLGFLASGGFRDVHALPYYGLGPGSTVAREAAARLQHTFVNGTLNVKAARWLVVSGSTGYERVVEMKPTDGSPDVREAFSPEEAPNAGVNPVYLHSTVSALALWQPSEFYSRRGGLARASVDQFRFVEGGTGSFARASGELVQHIPILKENWVVSLRARAESMVGGDQAPYYALPWLGGGDTLRGYSTARFRDRNSLLFSGEFRWIPNRLGMDGAIFWDAGQVAPRMGAMSLDKFEHDVGIGVRFHVPAATALRIELARSREGWQMVFAASAAF